MQRSARLTLQLKLHGPIAWWPTDEGTGAAASLPETLNGRGLQPGERFQRRCSRTAVTLYLDTSSLVKLYVEEPDSDTVRRLVETAAIVSTASIAYTETARRLRDVAGNARFGRPHSHWPGKHSMPTGPSTSPST